MATSKLPVDFVPVSDMLYRLSQERPGVYCNLRPNQRARREMEQFWIFGDEFFVHKPVRLFLQGLKPKAKVLMHFQGYGAKDQGTALVTIDSIYWTDEPYPRLDFKHPPELVRIHGCPNFWGAFILAITAAPETAEEFVREDRGGVLFYHTVLALGFGEESTLDLYSIDASRAAKRYYVQVKMEENWACSSKRDVCQTIADFLNYLPGDIDPKDVIEAFGRGKPYGILPLPE